MKFNTLIAVCILPVTMFVAGNAAAQEDKQIVIDGLTKKIYTSYNGSAGEVTQEDIRNNGLVILVKKDLKPKSLAYFKKGAATSTPLAKKNTAAAGELQFALEKQDGYAEEKISFELLLANGEKHEFTVTTAKPATKLPEVKATPKTRVLQPCEQMAMEKLHFDFIANNALAGIGGDCGDTCNGCIESDSKIVYNFRTNSTTTNIATTKKTSRTLEHPVVGKPLQFIIRQANPYLFDVTIKDTAINYNQSDPAGFLALLTGGDASVSAQGAGGVVNITPCNISDTLKLVKAAGALYAELRFFYGELLSTHPYTDAACFAPVIKSVKTHINKVLSDLFGTSLGISGFADLLAFMEKNEFYFVAENTQRLKEAYTKVATEHYMYVTKIPQVGNVDEVQFRFNILPKTTGTAMPFVKGGVASAYTSWGLKIDVSSGLYLANLGDDEFGIVKDSTQISASPVTFKKESRIYQDKQAGREFGFASYMHFYPRTGGWLNFSGTIGAGLNLSDKPRPRYFGGFSLIGGRGESRIVLSAGVACGNVTCISNRYEIETSTGTYKRLPETETKVETRQVFKAGWFVGVSYNLPFVLKKAKTPQVATPPVSQPEKPKDTTKKPVASNEATAASGTVVTQSAGVTAPINQQPTISAALVAGQSIKKEKIKKKFRN